MNNLARLYISQGRYAEAEPLFRRSLAIRERTRRTNAGDTAAFSLEGLANVCKAQCRYAEAETLLQRALAMREGARGLEHSFVAIPLSNLADVYKEQGRYAEAEPLLQRALAIHEKVHGREHAFVATTLNELANLYKRQGRYAEAEPPVNRAIGILKGNNTSPRLRFQCYIMLARLHWEASHRKEALTDLGQGMDLAEQLRSHASGGENERATLFAQYESAFEQSVAWRMELGEVDEALASAERSRARSLIDQMQLQGVDLLAGVPEDQARQLRQRDNEAKIRMASLEKQLQVLDKLRELSPEQRQQRQKELIAQLVKARQDVLDSYRGIRIASPAYRLAIGQDLKPVELSKLHAWVKEQEGLLLQYFLGDEAGYLFVIPADGKAALVQLEIVADQARELGVTPGPLTADRMREALKIDGQEIEFLLSRPDQPVSVTARLAALWRLLLPPAQRDAITRGKVKRLIVVPDGPLALLPLETLVVRPGEDPQYLLDAGPPIIYGPSATILYNLARFPRTGPIRGPGRVVVERGRSSLRPPTAGGWPRRASRAFHCLPLPRPGGRAPAVALYGLGIDLDQGSISKNWSASGATAPGGSH